jgi:hypothetical protein
MKTAQLLGTLAVLVPCVTCAPSHRKFIVPIGKIGDCPNFWATSVVELLAAPEEFYGQCVVVSGFYNGLELFLTREHADALDHSSSILVGNSVRGERELANECAPDWVTVYARLTKLEGGPFLQTPKRVLRGSGSESHECWLSDKIEK